MLLDNKNNNIPTKQRALVLQGGGALGAYEAAAIRVLCEHLIDNEDKRKKSNSENKKDGPLFDIIAGTSIGAMNAAVLVSNVVNRKKSWREAAKVLENFWRNKAKDKEKKDEKKGGLSSTGRFNEMWWQWEKGQNNLGASTEAARKHYSVKDYLRYGAPNVFYPHVPGFDFKFGDSVDPWFIYDSYPLEATIKRYSKDKDGVKKDDDVGLRISTSWQQREPRLLVISVDVVKGKTITFYSYHTEKDDSANPLYDGGDGITIHHIMASGTLPIFYKFREIPKEGGSKFCDGGVLSNTPFRELLQAHRDYWKRVVGEEETKIPDLDVYIINTHPPKWEKVPKEHGDNRNSNKNNKKDKDYDDLDSVQDRINDIIFSDRNSRYDEMVAELATDHAELIHKLKEFAKNHIRINDENSSFKSEFNELLNTAEGKSRGYKGKYAKYEDLIKGRFRLTNVTRIEPIGESSYKDSISKKGADFTSKTIRNLIEKGKKDAQNVLEIAK